MSNIFITGMSRSGTTLLAKIIDSFPDTSILQQPTPFFFRQCKKHFFNEINYPETYYVLNDYFKENYFTIEDVTDFIENYSLNKKRISEIFMEMKDFSGQITKLNYKEFFNNLEEETEFINFFKLFLDNFIKKDINKGFKEIQCEEFIPSFIKKGWKTVLIIRNPFDVISSIQYGKGSQYIGQKRPTLFHIRNWRKSANMGILFSEDKNFLVIKYEDLISDFEKSYIKLKQFLKIPDSNDSFENIKKSINNWSGNSSFEKDTKGINTKTLNRYKNVLPEDMVKYIEKLCLPELKFYGYSDFMNNKFDLNNFKEPFELTCEHFSQDFSNNSKNINDELERLFYLKKENIIKHDEYIRTLFINKKIYFNLRNNYEE